MPTRFDELGANEAVEEAEAHAQLAETQRDLANDFSRRNDETREAGGKPSTRDLVREIGFSQGVNTLDEWRRLSKVLEHQLSN